MELKNYINTVNDFPVKGVFFRDISPILLNPEAFAYAVERLAEQASDADIIVGLDSRGFVFGAPVALHLKKGFVMARKHGKLPGAVLSLAHDLEYGKDILEMQLGSIKPGQKVVIVDDLLATGGTVQAAVDLIHKQNGIVLRSLHVIELTNLRGALNLKIPVHALIKL